MLISCKCLNFIATSNNQQQKQQLNLSLKQQQLPAVTTAAVATADLIQNNALAAAAAMQQSAVDCNTAPAALASSSSNNNTTAKDSTSAIETSNDELFSLTNALRQTFLQKYPRNFIFYSQCVDFFKQAIGPVLDLTINVLSQRDLIYSLTVEITKTQSEASLSWQLCICSNCNVALFAKRLNNQPPQYLMNCGLLTNNEEISQKRSDKSFSDTFGILIMDHPKLEVSSSNHQSQSNNITIGSLSTSFATSSFNNHLDSKHLRLRQLQGNFQQRLQREIAETDERIQRYTEQQFALLKSFREKSEQEYQMLATLIQYIPEQQANEWMDRQPPNLDLTNNGGAILSYAGSRRRNTISSRRELNTAPTTPTSTQPPINFFNMNRENYVKSSMTATPISLTSAIMPSTAIAAEIIAGSSLVAANEAAVSTANTSTADVVTSTTPSVVSSSALNRKMSNFDTPPATPEATPMSVGNSPTFRQQQHVAVVGQQQSFQQQFPLSTVETADDCLFELEGVDNETPVYINVAASQQNSSVYLQNPPSPLRQQHQHQQQILPPYNNYQRNFSYTLPENRMSDLDESDGAEEAEDALDLDSSMPIAMTATPQRRITSNTAAQLANFAKSLPIEISNSPLQVGRNYMATLDSDDEELENNVDIAASIKALAKSVHGEAVFGDLPRPRLRSQI